MTQDDDNLHFVTLMVIFIALVVSAIYASVTYITTGVMP
jgi:hypothetical protein